MHLRSLYPPVPPTPPTNYHNVLFRSPEQLEIADHVIYIDAITGKQRKRLEFIDRLYDAATALGADKAKGGLGLREGDMVGIISENCLEYPLLVHALLAITIPFSPFSAQATPREMKHYMQKSSATHIFVNGSILPRLLPVARELGFPEENIYILEGKVPSSFLSFQKFHSLDSLVEIVRSSRIPREPVRPATKDTLAYIIFSSGTSGLPKAVIISHGNLCFSLMQGAIHILEIGKSMATPPPPDLVPVFLGFLPLSHTMALHYLCLKVPLHRQTIVMMPRWDIDIVLRAIPKYRVSALPVVPAIIHQLLSSPKFLETDLSSITGFGSGGAHLPKALERRLRAVKDVDVEEGYGMSETTISLMSRPQKGLMADRVGDITSPTGNFILQPGIEALLLHPDGTHCLPGEDGDLYVKGENVALGYWNNPEATKEAFLPDGWVRTGDRFRANTKGMFWFVDRAKDTIKVSGLQVAPAEIEQVIFEEPTGLAIDVAVAGVQTPGARTSDDQSPRAWVVLSKEGRQLGETLAKEAIDAWVKKNLSKYKWLRGGIKFVEQIPKNPSGKVLRRVLQDEYAAETTTAKL